MNLFFEFVLTIVETEVPMLFLAQLELFIGRQLLREYPASTRRFGKQQEREDGKVWRWSIENLVDLKSESFELHLPK